MNEPEELLAASEVYQAFLHERVTSPNGEINLTALHDAAGRPLGLSPRQWAGPRYRALLTPGGPRTPVFADEEIALEYAERLDRRIAIAAGEILFRKVAADPAASVMESPWPFAGLLAMLAVTGAGTEPEAARRQLTAEVAARTEGLGVYAQETAVAKAQRAAAAVRVDQTDLPTPRHHRGDRR